jgi:hypothetical protein
MEKLYAVNRNGGMPGILGQFFLWLRGMKPVTMFGVHEALHLEKVVNGDTLEGVESAEQIRQFGLRMAESAMKAAGVHIVVDKESQMMINDADGGINVAHEIHGTVADEQGTEIDKLKQKMREFQAIIDDSEAERDASIGEHETTKDLATSAAFFFSGKMLPPGSEQQATQ